MKAICTFLLSAVIIFHLPVSAQTSAFVNNISAENTNSADSLSMPKQSAAQKRAFDRQAQTFRVYPNPANNVVYLDIYGEQMVTLHNAGDSLIFKARIREKASVNIRKLPAGIYYFTDIKTGIKQPMIIAR